MIARSTDKVQQIFDERVLILICHPGHVIHDVSSIMLNQELRAAGLEVRVRRKRRTTLDKRVIRRCRICVRRSSRIVEGCEDTGRPPFLNEVTHDLVVEVLDRRPFNLLAHVFFLLSFQRQLNEDLLEFFVDIVDAELFERVVLKDFKAIYVEYANDLVVGLAGFHRNVNAGDDPLEEVIVDSLGKGVSAGYRLSWIEGDVIYGAYGSINTIGACI